MAGKSWVTFVSWSFMSKSWCGIVVRFGSSTIGAATSHWLVGETRVLSPEEDAVVTCVVLYRCIRMISSCCWSFRKKNIFWVLRVPTTMSLQDFICIRSWTWSVFLMCRSYIQWWHFYPRPGAGLGAEAPAWRFRCGTWWRDAPSKAWRQRDGDGFMVSYGPMVLLARRNIQPYYLNVNRGGSWPIPMALARTRTGPVLGWSGTR